MVGAIDLLEVADFLDAATVAAIRAELRRIAGAPAPVLGPGAGRIDPARRTTRITPSDETRSLITGRLMASIPEIAGHFGVEIKQCEPPQFLRYETGDYFVAHQDGNTPLVYDDSRHRRISAVIFLAEQAAEPSPDSYGGGDLVFHGAYTAPHLRIPAPSRPGTLVAFRSETTHEVTPVTHGERYTIVSWYRP